MNTNWSDYVQGVGTLYLSRMLRFFESAQAGIYAGVRFGWRTAIAHVGTGLRTGRADAVSGALVS